MRFTYSCPLPVPAEQAWERLSRPETLIPCIPGLESAQPDAAEPERYRFTVAAAVGPIRLRLSGSARVQVDAAQRWIQADVAMQDARSGSVHGRFTMRLEPQEGREGPAPGSRLILESDVAVAGRLGELGQSLIQRKADQLVREFLQSIQALMV